MIEPRKYRPKPVVVEAMGPITHESILRIAVWCGGAIYHEHHTARIVNYSAGLEAGLGDYVIRSSVGVFRRVGDTEFAATFESVDVEDRGVCPACDEGRYRDLERRYDDLGTDLCRLQEESEHRAQRVFPLLEELEQFRSRADESVGGEVSVLFTPDELLAAASPNRILDAATKRRIWSKIETAASGFGGSQRCRVVADGSTAPSRK